MPRCPGGHLDQRHDEHADHDQAETQDATAHPENFACICRSAREFHGQHHSGCVNRCCQDQHYRSYQNFSENHDENLDLFEDTVPGPGPFAHLGFHRLREQLDRVPVPADLPAAAERLVDLDQVGRNAALGGREQVLLLGIRRQGGDQGVETDRPLLVLDRRN